MPRGVGGGAFSGLGRRLCGFNVGGPASLDAGAGSRRRRFWGLDYTAGARRCVRSLPRSPCRPPTAYIRASLWIGLFWMYHMGCSASFGGCFLKLVASFIMGAGMIRWQARTRLVWGGEGQAIAAGVVFRARP